MNHIAYIGLGSNLANPKQQLRDACSALASIPNTQVASYSHWYISKPVGPQDQPDFVNGAAKLETELSPIQLLDELQAIENNQGRVRLRHWGPRTLDLDILLYDQLELDDARLIIPHKELTHRGFVAQPLFDISSDLKLPNGVTIQSVLAKLDCSDLIPLTSLNDD